MNPIIASFQTADTPAPAGTVAAGFLVTLTPIHPDSALAQAAGLVLTEGELAAVGDSLSVLVPLDSRTATFADVPPGSYRGSVAVVDANHRELAPGVVDTAILVIAETATVSIPVPTSLTLTRP